MTDAGELKSSGADVKVGNVFHLTLRCSFNIKLPPYCLNGEPVPLVEVSAPRVTVKI
jgi:hypothetical protein